MIGYVTEKDMNQNGRLINKITSFFFFCLPGITQIRVVLLIYPVRTETSYMSFIRRTLSE